MAKRHPFRSAWKAVAHAIDRAAFWAFPDAYAKRKRISMALALQKRMFRNVHEGAGTDRASGHNWLTSNLSPDSIWDADADTTRKRCDELYRDHPMAKGFVEGRVNNIVGTGLHCQSRLTTPALLEGVTPTDGGELKRVRRLRRQLERHWKQWQTRADTSGRKSLNRLQRLAERTLARKGEAFIVFSDKPQPGKPVPLAVEIVAPERVETPAKYAGDAKVRFGIRRDADGDPVTYYIRSTHPGDTQDASEEYAEVPADRVRHLYEELEPDQLRGFPPMHAVMNPMKRLGQLDEAINVKKHVEACLALFIATTGSPAALAAGSATTTNSDGNYVEELEPGSVIRGVAGEEPHIIDPSSGGGNDYQVLVEHTEHNIASGLGYPYELLTRSYAKTSYAGGRLSLIDGRVSFRTGQQDHKETWLNDLWTRFVDECVLAGLVDLTAAEYAADPTLYTACAWTPSGWPWIDPLKEVQSELKALAGNLASRAGLLSGRGLDDEEVQEERLAEAMLDAENEKRLRDYRASIGLDSPDGEPTELDRAVADLANLSQLIRRVDDLAEKLALVEADQQDLQETIENAA